MNSSQVSWEARVEDMERHLADLRGRGYEGAVDRGDKEQVFRRAFDLTTPVAIKVLEHVDAAFLQGRGRTSVNRPEADSHGGLIASWTLTWPLLEVARDRVGGGPLPPLRLVAIFPMEWTHGHLAILTLSPGEEVACTWPFQVITEADALRQEPILWAMAETELHERIFRAESNWRVIPEGHEAAASSP